MKLMTKSIIGFGMIGGIVGGAIGGMVFTLAVPENIWNIFYSGCIGCAIGIVFCSMIIKVKGMTEEDFKKGLEYECPKCKHGIYETKPICEVCGYVLRLDKT